MKCSSISPCHWEMGQARNEDVLDSSLQGACSYINYNHKHTYFWSSYMWTSAQISCPHPTRALTQLTASQTNHVFYPSHEVLLNVDFTSITCNKYTWFYMSGTWNNINIANIEAGENELYSMFCHDETLKDTKCCSHVYTKAVFGSNQFSVSVSITVCLRRWQGTQIQDGIIRHQYSIYYSSAQMHSHYY